MAKFDWINLKNQFVAGNWLTITDFFKQNKIKDNSRNRFNSKGWLKERKLFQEELAKRTNERIIEKEVDIRIRQQRIAKQLQVKGLTKLQELPILNPQTAFKMVSHPWFHTPEVI